MGPQFFIHQQVKVEGCEVTSGLGNLNSLSLPGPFPRPQEVEVKAQLVTLHLSSAAALFFDLFVQGLTLPWEKGRGSTPFLGIPQLMRIVCVCMGQL